MHPPVAPPHPREPERLESVARLDALIRDGDEALTNLTAIAAELCGSPIGLVTLVDLDQQYLVASTGLAVRSTPREQAFCAHAVLQDGIFEVPDATLDPRFRNNPLVTGFPGIRHYAGVPVVGMDGLPLGAFCVIADHPRRLDSSKRSILSRLGHQASTLLALRQQLAALRQAHRDGTQREMRLIHDLRPPLRSLVQLTRSLSRTSEPSAFMAVQAASTHLSALADTLLVPSGTPQTPTGDSEVHVSDLLDALVAQVRPLATTGVEVRSTIAEDVPTHITVCRLSLARALTNLLHNAVKFTTKGFVAAAIERRDGDLVFSVEDSGCGIAPDQLPFVFDCGTRAPAAQNGGAGLGLAITRELAEALGGSLEVTSERGTGTRFTITLPMHAQQPTAAAPATSPFRVLIAEDVSLNSLVAKHSLEAAGYRVDTVPDGLEALEALSATAYDVVLLDYFMPGPTGPDIARRTLARPGPAPLVLGWTGSAEQPVTQRFLTAGAAAVLNKPLDDDSLQTLARLLRERAGAATAALPEPALHCRARMRA